MKTTQAGTGPILMRFLASNQYISAPWKNWYRRHYPLFTDIGRDFKLKKRPARILTGA